MRGVTGVVPMIRAAMSGENRARRASSGNYALNLWALGAAQRRPKLIPPRLRNVLQTDVERSAITLMHWRGCNQLIMSH